MNFLIILFLISLDYSDIRSPSEGDKKKKSNNLEHKLETCSEILCIQEQKQLDTYCIFINVSPQLQKQHITTCINDRSIASMSSQTLNACVVQLQWDFGGHHHWQVNVIWWLSWPDLSVATHSLYYSSRGDLGD